MSTSECLFVAATAPAEMGNSGGVKEKSISRLSWRICFLIGVCLSVCLMEETTTVGGPRGYGFRGESPLRHAGFITAGAGHHKPAHRCRNSDTREHTCVWFYRARAEKAQDILSRTALRIFHPILSTLSPSSPRPSQLSYIFFSLPFKLYHSLPLS